MVYIHFPVNLTDEEEMLQRKFAKLRKKKKALQSLRTPKPEPPPPVTTGVKRQASESAEEAKEQAKKLLKSGAIKLDSGKKDSQGFKRSRNFEKKMKDQEKTQSVTFQPFSPTHNSSEGEEEGGRPRVKSLYDSFVHSRESSIRPNREERDREPREREPRDRDRERDRDRDRHDREPPKRGNTVYVNGHGITEDLIRKAFSNFGSIVNVTMETEKNVGFVTFEKMESADNAIAQMNGSMVSGGVQLKVSMARRQPSFDLSQNSDHSSNAGSSTSWSSIAASVSQKSNHKDSRRLVSYEDEDIF